MTTARASAENPYLRIRDRAEKKLADLGKRARGVADLWFGRG